MKPPPESPNSAKGTPCCWSAPAIRIDATKILSRRELAAVLDDLHQKAPRSANTWLNLILVRLSCCCGLRVSEIAGLQHQRTPACTSATSVSSPPRAQFASAARIQRRPVCRWSRYGGGTPVRWPTWANGSKAERLRLGATADAPFVASLRPGRGTRQLSRHTLRRRFRTACKVLGRERLETLTIHHGRHTFISHALAGDRKLAEVWTRLVQRERVDQRRRTCTWQRG